ncbi:pyridoxal-phosphate dependent enzyme [Frankia sp. Cppng1_Ct_nod]|uniref:threonine ammonia-lyase n=1 Tax=Frankia sp. Cppng1_Ct_nod TaxID=2897162 RepID=UPI001040F4B4|nr:pyridoxal-phosphate dependent enzyme [Frankia sp. Cppng1_Ct_nod]
MSRPAATAAHATSADGPTDPASTPPRPVPPTAGQVGRQPDVDIDTAHIDTLDIEVDRAAAVLAPVARRTRVVPSAHLSQLTGVPVWLKCEHEQHTASFKLRGAFTRIALADPAVRARGVVAASAGNHAQGVAYAAAHFDVPATIFVPEGANPIKVARTRRLGARVEQVPGGIDAALLAAQATAHDSGGLLVHPFDDPVVIAGQGTIGLELLDQVPGLRTVLVGVGGGGLITGIATAIRQRRANVRVIGVQATGAPAFARSWRSGHRLWIPPVTLADGIAVGSAGDLTLALAAKVVDDVVTVDEDSFWEAMVSLLRADGQRVEPAGAAGTAALLRYPGLAQGPTVVILSGGNVDSATARRVRALAAEPLDPPAA